MKKNYLLALSAILLVGITFSVIQIVRAGPTGPHIVGHPFSEIEMPADCTALGPEYYVQGADGGGWSCSVPSGGVEVVNYSGTVKTDGFACLDMDSPNPIVAGNDICEATTAGMIKIRRITCSTGVRDSLCYCGQYNDSSTTPAYSGYYWICLISCP